MNFLKSVLGSSGGLPGYSLQDKIDVPPSCIFSLHNATKRDDGAACSVFTYEVAKAPTLHPLAKNYLSKLRSLKHPGVVKLLDSLENETHIYIATERIEPLHQTLLKNPSRELLNWGLYSIAKTIAFINTEATSIHGNIRASSVFTTESGEWKIAGFESLTCMKDDEQFITRYGGMIPDIYSITPPELQQKGFSEVKNLNLTALDSFQFACLIHACYGSTGTLQTQGKIPNNMFAQYRRLLSPSASARLPVSSFLEFGRRPELFFHNDLISVTEQISDLPLKSKQEVEAFLSHNETVFAKLPSGFKKNRLLPEMIKSLEFGGGGSTALNAIITVANDLAPSDVEAIIAPLILRVWSSRDRATHLVMLEQLQHYIGYLTPKQINDKLFPSITPVFSDTAPIMRETAIRQVMILTPHLSDRNMNGDLLKCLAKTANDPQPGIRTNTTICLGKIANNLGGSKRKVLTAAFSRSLKDPYVHARMAALQAISATSEVYEKDDLALRLMPGIVPLLIDTEATVRDQALKCLHELLSRLERFTVDMAETASPPTAIKEKTALESAGVWAGWAVSSLSRNVDSPAPSTLPSAVPSRSTTPAISSPTTPNIGGPPKKGMKLERQVRKIDVDAIYAAEEFTNDVQDQENWGSEWDEPVPTKSKPKSSPVLAKPLAKSREPIKRVIKQEKPKPEEEEEWDTDAW